MPPPRLFRAEPFRSDTPFFRGQGGSGGGGGGSGGGNAGEGAASAKEEEAGGRAEGLPRDASDCTDVLFNTGQWPLAEKRQWRWDVTQYRQHLTRALEAMHHRLPPSTRLYWVYTFAHGPSCRGHEAWGRACSHAERCAAVVQSSMPVPSPQTTTRPTHSPA